MRHRTTLSLASTLVAGALGLLSARAEAVAECNEASSLERQIQACSILIEDDHTSQGNLAIAHTNRGNAFAMLRRPSEALKDYAAAISLNAQDPLAFYNRANVHFDLGRLKEAIDDYTRAIDLHSAFGIAYFNRGLARERVGDLKGATDDYRIVVALDASFAQKARARLKRLGANPHVE